MVSVAEDVAMRCLILMRNFVEGYKQVCLAAVHASAICNHS